MPDDYRIMIAICGACREPISTPYGGAWLHEGHGLARKRDHLAWPAPGTIKDTQRPSDER